MMFSSLSARTVSSSVQVCGILSGWRPRLLSCYAKWEPELKITDNWQHVWITDQQYTFAPQSSLSQSEDVHWTQWLWWTCFLAYLSSWASFSFGNSRDLHTPWPPSQSREAKKREACFPRSSLFFKKRMKRCDGKKDEIHKGMVVGW